jgi:hypothetical protein
MNSMLKVSLSFVALVSLLSIATLADAGTGIGGKPNSSIGGTQYRAYSYEPASLQAGDTAVVAKANAEVKLGDRVLATLPQGTQFKVLQTQGTWVGAAVEQNGQKITGWIAGADLSTK